MLKKRHKRSMFSDVIFYTAISILAASPVVFAISLLLGAAVSAVAPVLLPIMAIVLVGLSLDACYSTYRRSRDVRKLKQLDQRIHLQREELDQANRENAELATELIHEADEQHQSIDKSIKHYSQIPTSMNGKPPIVPTTKISNNVNQAESGSTISMLTGLSSLSPVHNDTVIVVSPDQQSVMEATETIMTSVASLAEKRETLKKMTERMVKA